MLTLILAVLSGAVVGGVFRLSGLVHSTAGAITPGVIALLATAILVTRRIGKQVNPIVEEAQRHLKGGRRELALASLRSGLRFRRWHPMLEGQLRAQIGALLYATGDLDGALPELERASSRPWESPAFLGCAHFKKHNAAPMQRAFERAVKVGKQDGLAWTVYAWCLLARGQKDEAVAVLKRGLEKLPADGRLKTNLELVQSGKKMKVAPYGDRWSSFQLDGSVPGVPKAARGFATRPGFRQRPQRRQR
jgi:tetratricopeptide (TPR) repeat protein